MNPLSVFSPAARPLSAAVGLLALIAVAAPVTAMAQEGDTESLTGRVVLDGAGVTGADLSLHRVTPDSSGVHETAVSGPDGAFSFTVPRPDTAGFTVYFVTADHLGVRYFGAPVHPGDAPAEYVVQVRDTTSAGDDLRVARRDLVMLPHADGGWEVNEVVRLRNAGARTVVSLGGMPTWEMDIPEGVEEFEAGAGDLPAEQIQRMGDRVLLIAPLLPGEREIFLRYRIPPGRESRLGAGAEMDSVNLFVQQPSPHVTVSGLRPVEIVSAEGQRFLQLSGSSVAADAPLLMEWESTAPLINPVWAGVGAAVLVVLIGAGAAFRNRTS